MSDQSAKPGRVNWRVIRWAGTILSVGLFIWLLTQVDWTEAWATLRGLSPWVLLAAVGLYVLGMVGNALRWWVLLRPVTHEVSFLEAVKIVFAGAFASNFLPSTVGGDALRVASIARYTGWMVGFTTVVADRMLNVFVMVTALPISWMGLGHLLSTDGMFPIFGLAAVSGEARWKQILQKYWKPVKQALMQWKAHPLHAVTALLVAYAAQMSIFSGVYLLARGLEMQVTIWDVIGIGTIVYLVSLVPASVNGFGLRDVSMAALYIQLGATPAQGSALALITRLILMIETLPGAFWSASVMKSVQNDERKSNEELTNS